MMLQLTSIAQPNAGEQCGSGWLPGLKFQMTQS